ncbi:methionyl-tRNA formyltransferase [Candidatus Campbellbacteria bacterium]|nr:MAG: methionyl-tRNA formyltransferase [Candidatus Campbellbacteria bacterium]
MKPSFVFFGSPDIAVASLNALFQAGLIPHTIVTAPDAPQGRGMVLTPPPAKVWALEHAIPVLQPKKLSDPTVVSALHASPSDFFVVVAYGKIIPQSILDIPRLGTLNMHPSLLPRHRGPSPIESQIVHEEHLSGVGVSIMLLDEKMDHGPVLAHTALTDTTLPWPMSAHTLRPLLAETGAHLLVKTLSAYLEGALSPQPQDDAHATYCAIIKKEDALIQLTDDAYTNYKKILAYSLWPRAFFFAEKNGKHVRVVITSARFENNTLIIERVIPEGKREMTYAEFLS